MHISIMGASRGVGFQFLKESDVDWIIVRPGFLTNGPKRGRYRAITDLTGVKAGKISRPNVTCRKQPSRLQCSYWALDGVLKPLLDGFLTDSH
jgi:hypothetical protein